MRWFFHEWGADMGTGSSATNAAAAANAQQQAAIQNSVNQINAAYGSAGRQAQYQQYGNNLDQYYTNQVNENEANQARNVKFAMARSGLTGGSAATDANTQLQKDYTQGLLQASRQAQAGQASLQQSDINAKNQLISLAQQGGNIGSIPGQVSAAQSAALGSAQNYGDANSLANLFSGTAQIYQNEQTAAANRKAQQSPIGSIYGSSGF
jgi:hypothetical protein